ncbi:LPXTG cell wall anchor domain-containing protein, partial [Rothia nasimurium]|uniref:LPXTG cell wall anchor domain-containing protein n=1 Tax=Rothia nasimurium TaxID=85336 RepID=UPI003BA1ED92
INGEGVTHELPEGVLTAKGESVKAEEKPTIDPATVVTTSSETKTEAKAEATKSETKTETAKTEAAKKPELAKTGASDAALLALGGLSVLGLGAGAVRAARRA